tara:strand:- start:2098 stop:2484 length:387 start_codon:yes stop_codon:yes gene_type:complete
MNDNYEEKNNTGALFQDDKVEVVRKGKIKINNQMRYASIIKYQPPNEKPKYELSVSVGPLYLNQEEDKKSDKSPDISGPISIDGKQYKFGGYRQTSKKGLEYTSVLLYEKEDNDYPFPSQDVDDGLPF